MQAKIATLPGDGIGPEVLAEGVRALQVIARIYGHSFQFTEGQFGGCAIDATGDPFPGATKQICRDAQAVLLGAVGGPKWSDPSSPVRPEQGLLGLRAEFDLFANLRPVKIYPELANSAPIRPEILHGTDMLIVRELTGGLYYGARQEAPKGPSGEHEAFDTMLYTAPQIRRVARVAFKAAQLRKSRLTSVDKANVLASSRLWRRVVDELALEYSDVKVEHSLVDSCAMHLILRPATFDVVLAENLFGDILSDEAAVLAGSLGMLPSASLNEGTFGVYEPIHGSAPDIAGQSKANPCGTILSCALLLRYSLGLETEALALESAVEAAIAEGARTADLGGNLNTQAFTDKVLRNLPTHAGRN